LEVAFAADTENIKRQRLELVNTSQRMAFLCDKKMSLFYPKSVASTTRREIQCSGHMHSGGNSDSRKFNLRR